MAMTMADNVIRKACDRCHTQKLSCKRTGEEPCERCTRLKTECKSSPSLRYKKQQQQQQQQHKVQQQYHQQQQQSQQHPQHSQHPHHHHQQQTSQQQVPIAETVQIRSRSPKRRRTDSDPSLVIPEAVSIVPQTEGLTGKSHSAVTPETVLDISDFNFNFDQLGFFAPNQSEHLSHPVIPSRVEDFNPQGVFAEPPWNNHQLATTSEPFTGVAPHVHPQQDVNAPHRIASSVPLRRRDCVSEHSISAKRSRPRSKHRPRQIALRQTALLQLQATIEASSAHWMAQLSEINTRLIDLSSALPQGQETAQNGTPLSRPSDDRFKANGFPIDEMFKLTRRVADILDQLSATTFGDDPAKARQARLDSSDPANSIFILSTYIRLLDMYQKVFNLVHKEISQTNSEAAFRFWKLPDVQVGSFAVESTPSLQMSLTIQLAEDFLCKLRNSTAALDSSLKNGEVHSVNGVNGSSMFSGVVDVSYQAVKTREETLGKHLAELREEIETFLDS